MREEVMEISSNDYFRVDLQDRLPLGEVKRRLVIKERLESQFERWQSDEQYVWSAIPQPHTVSFLGLEWSSILPNIRNYISSRCVAFELLSELQLCPIRGSIVNSYQTQHKIPPETWLYKQYQQYAIRIQEFGQTITKYHIPLIDLSATPSPHHGRFAMPESIDPDQMSRLVPHPVSSRPSVNCRLILFPQTRYSFLADEMFQALYPLPEEHVKLMAHKLHHRFRGNDGYYNVLPDPFADRVIQNLYGAKQVHYLAAMYPVVEFEFVADYESRKKTERFITSMQHQNFKNFPSISQWKYSRKFDLAGDSHLQDQGFQGDKCPERFQSARALFEYACGHHDTLRLDARQTSLLEDFESKNNSSKHLLVVDPLWIIIFPESNTICAFRNENMDDPFKEIWNLRPDGARSLAEILIYLINNADKCMGSYEAVYRKRLSSLQYQIHCTGEHHLVRLLSDFVAEVTIVLDPLQAQLNTLRHWQELLHNSYNAVRSSDVSLALFQDAIKTREVHLDSLKRLQEQARELQALLFQLSNTEAAYLQSQVAVEMAKETKLQVKLAVRNEMQNKSILIFTIITVIFLPLSFFTSYFGMNTIDIRGMTRGQGFFWSVSAPISIVVITIAFLIAFKGRMEENFSAFRGRSEKTASESAVDPSIE